MYTVEKAMYENGKTKLLIVDEKYNIHEKALFFSSYLYSQGYSVNTIDGYIRDLKNFINYLEMKGWLIEEIRPLQIAAYMDYLQGYEQTGVISLNEEKRSAVTINRTLASLASFYKCLENADAVNKSPFVYHEGVRPHGMYKEFLSYAKSNKVAYRNLKSRKNKRVKQEGFINRSSNRLFKDEIKLFREGLVGYRNVLIFDVLYETGMRIGELLGLQINDYTEVNIDSDFGYIRIMATEDNDDGNRQQKTGNRTIPVTMQLLARIDEYVLEHRPYIENQQYIFVSHKGKDKGRALTRDAIEKVFQKCSIKTKVKCTPHTLRHTHITELNESGFDSLLMKARAGHKSIYTTQRYTHPSLESQAKAYKKYISRQCD